MRGILTIAIGIFLGSLARISLADDWARWGGPNRNAVSPESDLLQEWPAEGPPLDWKVDVAGSGMGGIAIRDGRIYVAGDQDGSSWLFVLNEANGKLEWKARIGMGGNPGFIFKPNGPRCTPTVTSQHIYVLGQYGEFVCLTMDGKELWRTHYVDDLGGVMPKWGYSESPLLDGDKIVCVPGGPQDTIVALDRTNGKPIWKTHVPAGEFNPRYGNDSAAGYSSAIVVETDGIRQYVQFTATALVGVAADDGRLLWRYDRPANTHRIPCSTPLFHEGIVFASSAYDAGGGAVKLSRNGTDGVEAEELYFCPEMKNHHGGMIVVDGCLYGAAGGNGGGFLVCIDFATGEVLWRERDAPKGSLMMADGRLYLRAEDGTMILIEPNRLVYRERGRFQQPERTELPAWTHPVIANGKLYLRDQETLYCYDVSAN